MIHNKTRKLTRETNTRRTGTFKPHKAAKGTSSYQLRQFADATLGSGSLKKAVKLPEGEDINEWLAVSGRLLLCSEEVRIRHG